MGFATSVFRSPLVKNALVAVDKTVKHIPVPATYESVPLLRDIIMALTGHEYYYTLKFLFLTMFSSLLRQSNFLTNSSKKFDPERHLTRGDVELVKAGLKIQVKWEKNMPNSVFAQSVVIPYTCDPVLCPVRAYRYMCLLSPTVRGADPLIQFHDHNHMPVYIVQRYWNSVVKALGYDTKKLRMHRLRRGGATHIATFSPAARQQLPMYGRWKSAAYEKYIADPKGSHVYQAMSRL